jgi:hypothetical protein
VGLKEIAWDGGECSHVASNWDTWRAVVNVVMNVPVVSKGEDSEY